MLERRMLLLLLGALVVVGAFVVLSHHDPEPKYGGKRLSEWVEKLSTYPNPDTAEPAADAIRAMGARALPDLVKWVRYRPADWKGGLARPVKAVVLFFSPGWDASEKKKAAKARHAMYGLMALGPVAEPAVGELSKMLAETNRTAHAGLAPMALAHIGKAGLPPLIAAFTNQCLTTERRCAVAQNIGTMSTNARPAVAVLLQSLHNENSDIMLRAVSTLGALRLEPDVVVPALTSLLQDPRTDVQGCAAYALGRFGEMARQAVPALVSLLKDRPLIFYPVRDDTALRVAVTNALMRIDPKALENAGHP